MQFQLLSPNIFPSSFVIHSQSALRLSVFRLHIISFVLFPHFTQKCVLLGSRPISSTHIGILPQATCASYMNIFIVLQFSILDHHHLPYNVRATLKKGLCVVLGGDHSSSHTGGCLLGHLGYISIHPFLSVQKQMVFVVVGFFGVFFLFFLRRDLVKFQADSVASKPTIWHGKLDPICDRSDQNRYLEPKHDVFLTVTKCLNLSRAARMYAHTYVHLATKALC